MRRTRRRRQQPLLDQLVGYAISYFQDFVKPAKSYRAPTERERAALLDLDGVAKLPEVVAAEEIQAEVYEVGKEHGFEPLRDWFKALYEVCSARPRGRASARSSRFTAFPRPAP